MKDLYKIAQEKDLLFNEDFDNILYALYILFIDEYKFDSLSIEKNIESSIQYLKEKYNVDSLVLNKLIGSSNLILGLNGYISANYNGYNNISYYTITQQGIDYIRLQDEM